MYIHTLFLLLYRWRLDNLVGGGLCCSSILPQGSVKKVQDKIKAYLWQWKLKHQVKIFPLRLSPQMKKRIKHWFKLSYFPQLWRCRFCISSKMRMEQYTHTHAHYVPFFFFVPQTHMCLSESRKCHFLKMPKYICRPRSYLGISFGMQMEICPLISCYVKQAACVSLWDKNEKPSSPVCVWILSSPTLSRALLAITAGGHVLQLFPPTSSSGCNIYHSIPDKQSSSIMD